MICLVRCDERLIHGQCMQFICSDYSIKKIIVVDNMTASNPILKTIFTKAVPPTITANVYSVKESEEVIRKALTDNVNTLLLMKHPSTYVELKGMISELPNDLNIGPQMARDGFKCVDFATLTKEDVEACKQLTADGVRVYFNSIGASGAVTEWTSVANKL